MRVGIGYDVHRLERGLKFILGGVNIEHEKGLVAHSDGDCLIHSIIDAILGACGLCDIGTYFPDTSEEFRGISSLKLLEKTLDIISKENFKIVNIDSTIICQKPKVKPYIEQMKINISSVLNISPSQISIKATTEEKLGFTGKEEGVATQAICLVQKIKESQ